MAVNVGAMRSSPSRVADAASAVADLLPSPPLNPLPLRDQMAALRTYHTGAETLRDAGGRITQLISGPKWLMPPIVLVSSPQGTRDVLGRSDTCVDKEAPIYTEVRRVFGANLFDVPGEEWLPRRRALQPVFTRQRVDGFARHMFEAAVRVIENWPDDAEIDLDAESRRLTLRALGRSVLGLDLDEQVDAIATPMRTALRYANRRAMRPVRSPHWLPTPARRRARAASARLHAIADDILRECLADPTRDAPLVHALIAATDPSTGSPLADPEIGRELVVFLVAGHETTSTTLTYALWSLGRHAGIQERVAAEVAALGDRPLLPDDMARLPYLVQVLQEAMRLCPPVPMIARIAKQDIAVDGFRVNAGTVLMVSAYAMMRDPALWDDPLRFDPDRFAPDAVKRRDRWQYLPFGAGPRSCIGDHFAMLEATLGLATIVRRYRIRSRDDGFPVALPFTMVAGQPIRAQVTRRQWPSRPRPSRSSSIARSLPSGPSSL